MDTRQFQCCISSCKNIATAHSGNPLMGACEEHIDRTRDRTLIDYPWSEGVRAAIAAERKAGIDDIEHEISAHGRYSREGIALTLAAARIINRK